ncbi:YybH family protein [Actinoplanes sp. CA-030573]|uniref:YybH family protein n=1 Tax=Actinoplanes sp. CA-030573 TaxID=3239898 RepID=UPI003D92F66B
MTSHVELFNAAVRSGDWASFAALFHPEAVMTFKPGPSFQGREAILAAYQASPPSDTMRALGSRFVPAEEAEPTLGAPAPASPPGPPGPPSAPASSDISEITDFEWSKGGTGTMTIRRSGGLITMLAVEFT